MSLYSVAGIFQYIPSFLIEQRCPESIFRGKLGFDSSLIKLHRFVDQALGPRPCLHAYILSPVRSGMASGPLIGIGTRSLLRESDLPN